MIDNGNALAFSPRLAALEKERQWTMTILQTTGSIADTLEVAAESRTAVPPVAAGLADVSAAYAVQQELTARRISRGAVVVGRKIGLTSEVVQRQLGVDQPDFGVLFDDMGYVDGATVSIQRLIQPRIEAEVAFVLGEDLADGEITIERVRTAVDYAVSALEIVDSRIADWRISLIDTVADNASCGLFVLGADQVGLAEFEPAAVEMTMSVNGRTVSTGSGAACLGDPLAAVLWLALTAQRLGDPLLKGQIILSGALGPMVDVVAGDHVCAELSSLGPVSVSFDQGVSA